MTDLAALQKILETGADLPLPIAEEWARNFGPFPDENSDEESIELSNALEYEECLISGHYSAKQPTLEKPTQLEVIWAHIGCGLIDCSEAYKGVKTTFQINAGLMDKDEKTNEVLYLLEEVFKNRRIEGFRNSTAPLTEKQNAPQPLSKLEQLEQMMRNKKNNDTPSHS